MLLMTTGMDPVLGANFQSLSGHVPKVLSRLTPAGRLAATNRLQLSIGLPLRHTNELTTLLAEIYSNPGNPNYRHYLTPAEFTQRFGPTEADYNSVIAFARTNGLAMRSTYSSRIIVDVEGSVADIEKALHITLRTYPHPQETRQFFAPDTEPTLNLGTPILHISGLDNLNLPRALHRQQPPGNKAAGATPQAGSAPYGFYAGNDFRAAYVPGVTLTGSGQSVALVQFAGYYHSDIQAYEATYHLPNVPLTDILLNGIANINVGGGNAEPSLDIEMAISMAPGLAQVITYYGTSPDSIMAQIAADDIAKQISCSWAFVPDSNSLQSYQEMAAQGQSYFNASGDSDAYTPVNPPIPCGDVPYATSVGGTTLTTSGPVGSWVSESVWNWGAGGANGSPSGSCGGISTSYAIPSWQQGISMTANQGSTTMHNLPDVAMCANNVWVLYGNGSSGGFGGTSCASPLWAGFTALVNQYAVSLGSPTVGFIDPAIYAIGKGSAYNTAFHDITTGNNTWSNSPSKFYAVTGYDLCTGWGTPFGFGLISALVAPVPIVPTPNPPFVIISNPSFEWPNMTGTSPYFQNFPTDDATSTGLWQTYGTFGAVVAVGHYGTTPSGIVGSQFGDQSANFACGVFQDIAPYYNGSGDTNLYWQAGYTYTLTVGFFTRSDNPVAATDTLDMKFYYRTARNGTLGVLGDTQISGSQVRSGTLTDFTLNKTIYPGDPCIGKPIGIWFESTKFGGSGGDWCYDNVRLSKVSNLSWKGNLGPVWDKTTANWISSGVATDYYEPAPPGSSVTFDDTAVNFTVDISTATVNPLFINMTNGQTYTFTGSLGIGGTGALIKQGAGSLVLSNAAGANTYSGITTVSSGSIVAGGQNVLSANSAMTFNNSLLNLGTNNQTIGNITFNNSSLVGTGTLSNGSLTFNNGTANFTLPPLAGNLSFAQNGTGTISITSGNTYGGATYVNAGTVRITDPNALGVGGFSGTTWTLVARGGALMLDGNVNTPEHVHMLGSGPSGGGVLVVTNGNSSFNQPIAIDGASVINIATGSVLTIGNQFYSSGSITKIGGGTLILASGPSSQQSGGYYINAGSVLNSGVVSGQVTVSGGAFGGNGTVNGLLNNLAGGTIIPGALAIGTLTVNNSFTNAGNITEEISYNGASTSADLINVATNLVYGGTLTVTNVGPNALVAGQTFKLFNASSYSNGAFSSVTLPPLAAGLGWTNMLAINGSIGVVTVATVSATPFSIGVSVSGGMNLNLTWPADHTGWRLLVQTNNLPNGISANANDWGTVPNSTSTNMVSIPISPVGNTNEYYRMVYP